MTPGSLKDPSRQSPPQSCHHELPSHFLLVGFSMYAGTLVEEFRHLLILRVWLCFHNNSIWFSTRCGAGCHDNGRGGIATLELFEGEVGEGGGGPGGQRFLTQG